MEEIWKELPGYPMYMVSNLGKVKSLRRNIIMSQRSDKGYFYVNVYNNGRKTLKVHQMVAMAFLNYKPSGFNGGQTIVVDHINNIQSDNRLSNLQLITCSLNNKKDKKNLGVSYHKVTGKWVVRVDGRYIGSFSNEEEAKKAAQ